MRLDLAINLASLDRLCHGMYHDGHLSRDHLLEIVARREKIPDWKRMQDLIVMLRNAPKAAYTLEQIAGMVEELR